MRKKLGSDIHYRCFSVWFRDFERFNLLSLSTSHTRRSIIRNFERKWLANKRFKM
jgi:hypothetical protein